MDIVSFFTDLFFNLDAVLAEWAAMYGVWIYAILFLIIFLETGVVVMPFLPGDSLLFAGGAIAAVGGLNIWALVAVLFVAAVLGDAVNYTIGRKWGRSILDSGRFSRVITPEHVAETEAFFCRHGGKTISLARFFPFIRTFAPFIAGIGHMDYGRFALYNVTGAAAWIVLFVGAGYFFGNIPAVAENLEYLVIGIILVSISPGIVHAIQRRLGRKPKPVPEECAK